MTTAKMKNLVCVRVPNGKKYVNSLWVINNKKTENEMEREMREMLDRTSRQQPIQKERIGKKRKNTF